MSGGGGTKAPETCGSFFDMLHEPRVLIGRLWLLTNLALFGFSFLAIAVAVANHHCQEGQTCDRSLGFAAVWTLIIALAMAIGGTKLLRSRTVCCVASARCLLPPPSPLLLLLLLLLVPAPHPNTPLCRGSPPPHTSPPRARANALPRSKRMRTTSGSSSPWPA